MKLKRQLTLASAAAVALAIVAVSIAVYFIVEAQLRAQVDRSLENEQAAVAIRLPNNLEPPVPTPGDDFMVRVPSPQVGDVVPYVQLITQDGKIVVGARGHQSFAPSSAALDVAASGGGPLFEDIEFEQTHLRLMTRSTEPGVAIQVGRSMEEVDATLRRLVFFLVALAVVGIAVAAGLGRVVATAALRPVGRLTDTAEHVATTSDLSQRIDVQGEDEIGRLASTFNRMLAALEESLRAQKQLVADASHELRTPLTSVRTNLELLARSDASDEVERNHVLDTTMADVDGLTSLVTDVVDLARGNEPVLVTESVQLDEVVADVIGRARNRSRDVEIRADLEPCAVTGNRFRLERAVSNLVDNALKWAPQGSTVYVSAAGSEVTVRDQGPGINELDIPRIFDRFYRAPAARSQPGSGLGLAIVKQIADAHGGQVTVERPPEGGALFRLRLPVNNQELS